MNKKVLVTGARGFIGYHLCKKLLNMDYDVVGVDISYSGITQWPEDDNPLMKQLKDDRLKKLQTNKNFSFIRTTISATILSDIKGPLYVVNLAARAGIPFSRQSPIFYECDNAFNFAKLWYNLRNTEILNFVYASSSSVYGGNDTPTGCTEDMTLNPLNIYANTKMYNEYQAKLYGELYKVPNTGLRFFTVYGPFGRIDMAIYKWATAITNGNKVLLNNNGNMFRDFTFIDDIVNGIVLALENPHKNEIYNLGRGESVEISKVVDILEKNIGNVAYRKNLPYPEGEVYMSLSNVDKAKKDLGFVPKVSIEEGIEKYIKWYKDYYR